VSIATPRRSQNSFVRRFLSNRVAVAAAVILLFLVLVAIFAPWITPHDPNDQDIINRLKSPSESGVLGTDDFGRDVLSRLIIGTRVSLMASAEAVAIAALLGVPFGMLAGFHGGLADTVTSRVSDSIMSVPFLIMALTVISVIGYGLGKAMFVVGIVFAPNFFRVARAATQDVRGETYIEASTAIGCSTARTIWAHVLPNSLSPLLVQTTVTLGLGVSVEASLSFLGLGATPPTASWGSMLRTALTNVNQAAYLVWAPGIVITLTVLSLTLVGDGLRDAIGTRRVIRGRRRRVATPATALAIAEATP